MTTRLGAQLAKVLVLAVLASTRLGAAQDRAALGLDGHKIVRVTATTRAQVDAVVGLTGDVWSHGYGVGTFDVRVPADGLATLDRLGVAYAVLIPDVQAAIDAERAEIERRNMLLGGEWFESYHNYFQIKRHLAELAGRFPDLAETIWLDGETHEAGESGASG